MAETTSGTTELSTQYATQVAGDLERNLKEQDLISGEIEALQAQLTALQHDHTVLVSIQQAIGLPATPPAPATVPAPRKKGPGSAKQAKQTGTATPKRASRKGAAKAEPATSSAAPTLVELLREHLAGQSEPRSAAEIAASLGQQHPGRTIKTTVVRTTLEGLVAKSQARRSKQGKSVFYTAAPTAPGEETPQQSD
ncbi:hypothetical protein [Streptomyces sp. NPDC055013]